DQIKSSVDQYKGILSGQIKIASASSGKYVIPYFLTGFMRKHPGVSISIDVANKTKVVEKLQENSIDFAMISVIPSNLSLNCIPLIRNELQLVASADYPGINKRMPLKKLNTHTLIFREKGSATRAAMENYLQKNQVQTKRSMYLVSNEAVKQAVKAGLGLSIMPLVGIRSELALNAMKIVQMKNLPIVTQWNLAYGSGKQLSPVHQALIEYISEHKERIGEKHFS
ncbi:MAG: LysR substrate-binding domain-containing protein, partial [Bacteroidota bacterium]